MAWQGHRGDQKRKKLSKISPNLENQRLSQDTIDKCIEFWPFSPAKKKWVRRRTPLKAIFNALASFSQISKRIWTGMLCRREFYDTWFYGLNSIERVPGCLVNLLINVYLLKYFASHMPVSSSGTYNYA